MIGAARTRLGWVALAIVAWLPAFAAPTSAECDPARIGQLVLTVFSDELGPTRAQAVRELARCKDDAVVKLLANRLGHEDEQIVRIVVIGALRAIGSEAA